MREIKFRGKLQKEYTPQGWVYGDLVKYVGNHYIMDDGCNWDILESGYKVIPETVGQFTGLLDKHEVRIFEGDIVMVGNGWNELAIIVFDTELSRFMAEFEKWGRKGISEGTSFEVIGNIHTNPELLESE